MPRQYTRIPQDERFWSHVDRSGGPDACWPWMAYRTPNGYGLFGKSEVDGIQLGRNQYDTVIASRFAFELTNGPIPHGLCVCHQCDNPPCCNPAHLFLGTDADNMHDRDAKGRDARGDRHGWARHPESKLHGERNGRARLTWELVREIRAAYRSGVRGYGHKVLARKYGVGESTIAALLRGESWRE